MKPTDLRTWPALITIAVVSHLNAATGPIVPQQSADHILDSFEAAQPMYKARARGKASFELSYRSGIARHGNRSLLVEMKPSREKGRHSLLIHWRFDPPADWSAYEGLSLWLQCHDDPPPSITPVLFEAGGASYWWRGMMLEPRKQGQWQLVELPFRKWTWSWEAKKDENGKLDLGQIRQLRFEIRAFEDRPLILGMDGLGVYNPRPPYTGPTLWLKSPDKARRRFVPAPGEDYTIVAEVRQLAPGQSADVELVGRDYWGTRKLEEKLSFVGAPGGKPQRQEVSFPNDGPGYIGLVGTVLCAGRPVYRAETGVGCIAPMDPLGAKPNANSIFGIWVGGGHEAIGAKWTRLMLRIKEVTKAEGKYQLKGGGPPGVPRPKWGWGAKDLNRIVCFVDMAKWLSSRPDRADFQKWSPTSWDEYARIIQWVVAGTSEAGIRHYEVWNEPVPYAYWMGPMESVVKLHEVTYKAIKSVQPDAVVLGPCPYTFKWDFLDQFFTLGGGQWIDQVVVHTYDSQPPDVNFADNLRKLRKMLARFGLGDRDIYITEMGYGTPNATEREQARNMVRAFVYALSERVRVFVWHMLWDWQGVRDPQNYIGDPGHAIQRFDKSPRPAYIAYATMTRVLERAKYLGPVEGLSDTQRGFEFSKRGKRIRVLWDTGDQPTRLPLPDPSKEMVLINIVGGETKLAPARPGQYDIQVSSDPIYLISE